MSTYNFNPLLKGLQEAERAFAAIGMINNGVIADRAFAMTGADAATVRYVQSLGVASAAELSFGQKFTLATMQLRKQAAAFIASPLGKATLVAAGIFAVYKGLEYLATGYERAAEKHNASTPVFHFCNIRSAKALVVPATKDGDSVAASVPNILLQCGVPIFAYIYCEDENGGRTIHTISIPVYPRAKPCDYEYVENIEYISWVKLESQVNDLINDISQTSFRVSGEYVQFTTNGTDWENLFALSGIKGEDGKSAYAYAQDGGYTGTEEEFAEKLAEELPAKTSQLTNDSGYITKAVSDLENYYRKSEVYSQDEVKVLVSTIPKFAIQPVTALPTADISETTIYLLSGGEGSNLYTEYIHANGRWEILGSQQVDLTGYALKSELPEKPLIDTTANIKPAQVLEATQQGRTVCVRHTDATYGLLEFSSFSSAAQAAGIIVSSVVFEAGGMTFCAQLTGDVSKNAWSFNALVLALAGDLSAVAKSGSYNDLADKPELPKAFNVVITDNGDGTGTTDKTFAQIMAAHNNGSAIIGRIDAGTITGLMTEASGEYWLTGFAPDGVYWAAIVAEDGVLVASVPMMPKTLPNPNALTIGELVYDGSQIVDITDAVNALIDAKLNEIPDGEELTF